MNEKTNLKNTGDDQSNLEKRYATARNVAIALFVLVFLCVSVAVSANLTMLFGSVDSALFRVLLGIGLGSIFLGIISGWVGVFFGARALIFRSKLHFGTDSVVDALLAAVVKRMGKHIPAGLVDQAASQEPKSAEPKSDSADEMEELRRELKELREREENGKNRGGGHE